MCTRVLFQTTISTSNRCFFIFNDKNNFILSNYTASCKSTVKWTETKAKEWDFLIERRQTSKKEESIVKRCRISTTCNNKSMCPSLLLRFLQFFFVELRSPVSPSPMNRRRPVSSFTTARFYQHSNRETERDELEGKFEQRDPLIQGIGWKKKLRMHVVCLCIVIRVCTCA